LKKKLQVPGKNKKSSNDKMDTEKSVDIKCETQLLENTTNFYSDPILSNSNNSLEQNLLQKNQTMPSINEPLLSNGDDNQFNLFFHKSFSQSNINENEIEEESFLYLLEGRSTSNSNSGNLEFLSKNMDVDQFLDCY
jgi:hypothetical protein